MTRAHASYIFFVSLISGACMSAPAQSPPLLQPSAGYTGMDDLLIPTPPLASIIQSETYPFRVISSGGANDRPETGTRVYVTSESFKTPTSTSAWADHWATRHSDPESRYKLLSRTAVESQAIPVVLDDKGKVFSSPYMLTFETQGAKDFSGTAGNDDYDDHYR